MARLLFLCLVWSVTSLGAGVKVVGDRINLRAGDSLATEILGQVNNGDVLDAVFVGEQWVKIVPPTNVSFWIHGELAKDGVVTSSKVNVRALPGINSTVVGRLEAGTRVTARGTFNEWMKIAPPPGCFLWISREFVTLPSPTAEAIVEKAPEAPVAPRKPATPGPAQPPAPAIKETLPAGKSKALPDLPQSLKGKLAPDIDQGSVVLVSGILTRPLLPWGHPSRLVVVRRGKWGSETLCYLLGNEKQLKKFAGRHVQVQGRCYWTRGAKHPVVMPEQILLGR